MKVKELLKELKDLDPEREIILSDGNNNSPLSGIDQLHYLADGTNRGELFDEHDVKEFDPDGESPEVVVFYSTF